MLTRDHRGAVLGGTPLADVLAAAGTGTPIYVYDLDGIEAEARALTAGFEDTPHLIAYAVKASSAGPIVRTLARAGCGADVVSGGELAVALACGVDPERVMFSGVAKQSWEIDRAIGAGARGILAIQMESVEEIERVDARAAALGRRARVSLRINPGVEADTHAHIATGHDEAKFGVAKGDLGAAFEALSRAKHLLLVGLGGHLGSQLTSTAAYESAAEIWVDLATQALRGAPLATTRRQAGDALEFVDLGGGFGVDYGLGCAARPADFARIAARLGARSGLRVVVEPGRSLVAPHGVLCATVLGSKQSRTADRRWLMIDAGMNDLVRPALYGAWHRIEPLEGAVVADASTAPAWRVVGPVCESSDDFGAHPFAALPERVVIRDAGAYGFTMASEYNGRALPAEVFVRGGRVVATSRPRTVDTWIAERLGILEDP
jgi:diaminopimelate decarboxylase